MTRANAVPPAPPIAGVVFDFHHTIVHGGDAEQWLDSAWAALGRPESPRSALGDPGADEVVAFLDRLWEHARAIDPGSERDLDSAAHRDVFDRTVAQQPLVDAALSDALYTTMHDQWAPYDDAVPVIEALRDNGIGVVLLSNVGYDLSPVLARTGLDGLFDGVVMSVEVGVVKPGPEIFRAALDLLGLDASEVLMVGDAWQDDSGAAALGIRTLILPRTEGPVHGLGIVLDLVGVGRLHRAGPTP